MGTGALLPRFFFCCFGVAAAWGKIVLLPKNILIFARKQCVRFLQTPGQSPVRVCVYPDPWVETSYTPVERGAARL